MQGMISGEELSSAYASADIFMMPSESETLGFVALEAMASGLAVVAVAAGGLVDIVTKPGIIGRALPEKIGFAKSACLAFVLLSDFSKTGCLLKVLLLLDLYCDDRKSHSA